MKTVILVAVFSVLVGCITNPVTEKVTQTDRVFLQGSFSDWEVDTANIAYPGWLYKVIPGITEESILQLMAKQADPDVYHSVSGYRVSRDSLFVGPPLKEYKFKLTIIF